MIDPRLAQARARWAERPAQLDPEAWWGHSEPAWVEHTALVTQRRDLPTAYRQGEAMLAWVVQANTLVWEGKAPAPADLLVSWDPLYALRPERLRELAARIHAVAEAGSAAVALRGLVTTLRDDRRYCMREPLAGSLAEGRVVYRWTCLVFPQHLPGGRLLGHLVPVVALRDGPPVCSVPPADLWPDALREEWEQRA